MRVSSFGDNRGTTGAMASRELLESASIEAAPRTESPSIVHAVEPQSVLKNPFDSLTPAKPC